MLRQVYMFSRIQLQSARSYILVFEFQSLQWRKLNQVDKILEEWRPPEVMQKYFSTGQLGIILKIQG